MTGKTTSSRGGWVAYVMPALVAVVVVNLFFLWMAVQTQPGPMEERSPYLAGQEYQAEIDAIHAFERSGLHLEWKWGNPVELRLTRRLPGWSVRFSALRTDHAREDLKGELVEVPGQPGVYRGDVLPRAPKPGLWFLKIEFEGHGQKMLWKGTSRS